MEATHRAPAPQGQGDRSFLASVGKGRVRNLTAGQTEQKALQ
jgi:hypothetical protein